MSDRHTFFLQELCNNLPKIGILHNEVDLIIKEPMWNGHKVPDLIIRLKDGQWIVIELKGNAKKKYKALKQISGGVELLHKKFGISHKRIRKMFVVYNNGGYKYERVGT